MSTSRDSAQDSSSVENVEEIIEVEYPGYGTFLMSALTDMMRWRAKTFLKKEPTTLEWLQSLEPESILIDIGANVGIYSIPSALFHVSKVVCVEPEPRSYSSLLRNIEINNIPEDKIEALPLAISTEFEDSITRLYLTKDEPGSSCHQLGRNQNHLLQPLSKNRISRSVYTKSLASIIDSYAGSGLPIHIKIHVDGIEADVCQSLFDSRAFKYISSLQI